MPQKLSDLPLGALVKDTTTRYYNKPIVWKIADKNHTGYPANSVTLISDKILCLKCFDAKEPSNSNADRKAYGNNRYSHSNLRQWLNSDASSWYTAQHSADAPPSAANVEGGYNPYNTEAGFLSGFSAKMKAALMSTTLVVAKNTVTDGGSSENVVDRIFLASYMEARGLNASGISEGSVLALFTETSEVDAYPTAEAVANSNYTDTTLNTYTRWHWKLRTPFPETSNRVHSGSSMSFFTDPVYNGRNGVRPLCNIPADTYASDTVDLDGAYTLIWNKPPSAPNNITVSDNLISGGAATINWGTAADLEGTVSGYILERSINSGSFAQIYKGINRTYTDTIEVGWKTIQYRVKAYNNYSLEGDYASTGLLSIAGSDPAISGSDGDLGLKTGAFSQSYTVTNPDEGINKTLTVVERIDGVLKRQFTATSGSANTFSVTADEWLSITNGTHTITITVTDNYGGTAIRTYTFSKSMTEIELTLTTPFATEEAAAKAIMNITRQIPLGADFSVEVCNNAYDAEPTWEDVTAAVVAGSKIFLTNTKKTAAKWGFNLQVKVNRKGAAGDCFIRSIGGNFQ